MGRQLDDSPVIDDSPVTTKNSVRTPASIFPVPRELPRWVVVMDRSRLCTISVQFFRPRARSTLWRIATLENIEQFRKAAGARQMSTRFGIGQMGQTRSAGSVYPQSSNMNRCSQYEFFQ